MTIPTNFELQSLKNFLPTHSGLFSKYLFHPETFRGQRVASKPDKTLTILACFSTKLTFLAVMLSILLKNTPKLSKFCQFFKRRVALEMFRDETNSPLCNIFKWIGNVNKSVTILIAKLTVTKNIRSEMKVCCCWSSMP